jgi:hypothetical protein
VKEMSKIYYEPHPITVERKTELIEKGFKIIDARFMPKGWVDPLKPKRKTRNKYGE